MGKVILIGTSAGGLKALSLLLPALPADFPAPLAVVQHLDSRQDAFWVEHLDGIAAIRVKEAEDKERLVPGTAVVAPPNYHLLVEANRTVSLSVDAKVNHSRPSIDVLFESAAAALGGDAVAVVLTGASRDGAAGLAAVRAAGGLGVVQEPASAAYPTMPRAALDTAGADYILPVEAMGALLIELATRRAGPSPAR